MKPWRDAYLYGHAVHDSPEWHRIRSWRVERLARASVAVYAGMPPLPKGKRLRNWEHWRRLRMLDGWRFDLLAALRQRFRALLDLREPKPLHGPRCGPGVCADCTARLRWRERVAARNAIPEHMLIGMTGQRWTPHSAAVMADAELWRQLRVRADNRAYHLGWLHRRGVS